MDLILLKPGINIQGENSGNNSLVEEGDLTANCIELLSLHFGMKQQITTDVSHSARTSGRPTLSDFTAVKYLDNTSTLLYKHCLSAEPIDDGVTPTPILMCRNAEMDGQANNVLANFMTIKLWDCLISSIEAQSHPDDMATEQMTLNFTKIEWVTSEPVALGSNSYQWSVAKNRSL